MPPDVEEQFIYPTNPTLRRAYQALISKVLEERSVVFQPTTLILTIVDFMGWVDDSNLLNLDKPEGTYYKKAKNILRTFEGSFTKFNRAGLEVFIFKKDRQRVKTFEELELLCAADSFMNEIVATTEKLDLSQRWGDVFITPKAAVNPVLQELKTIDTETKYKKEVVAAGIEEQKKNRLVGVVKGSQLSEEALTEFVLQASESGADVI